ncbi:MAG: sigma 54-interacting transcriptional regulator [Desulfocucumaceae bacterium]
MNIKSVSNPNPVIFSENARIADFTALFCAGFRGAALVVDGEDHIKGVIVTDTIAVDASLRSLQQNSVSSLINNDFIKVPSSRPVEKTDAGDKVLVIVDKNNDVEGVVLPSELSAARLLDLCNPEPGCRLINKDAVVLINQEKKTVALSLMACHILAGGRAGRKFFGQAISGISGIMDAIASPEASAGKKVEYMGKLLNIVSIPAVIDNTNIGNIVILNDFSSSPWIISEILSLQELNRELEVILDSSYDELFVVDAEGTTLRVNSSACQRLYGVDAKDIIGKNVKELVREGLFSPSIASLVREKKQRMTTVQETKSGKKIIVTSNPVFNDKGEVVRIVTNSREITELNYLRDKLEESRELNQRVCCELSELRKKLEFMSGVVIYSNEMKKLFEVVDKVADVDSTILILGESGVGKDIVSRTIHRLSKRCKGPFIKINCSAIPENLLEAELFGYEYGAFTGAKKEGKPGLIEMAEKGTLFLDEIGELPGSLQVKLLQVIQDRQLMRIGGLATINVDVRIIAATNRDLEKAVSEGRFREDLYYRLNVIPIEIPPLRERCEEIAPLTFQFLQNFGAKHGIYKKVTAKAMEALMSYNWPGNVRELENVIERLVVTTDSKEIDIEHLPKKIRESGVLSSKPVILAGISLLKDVVDETEKQLIQKAYRELGNTMDVASSLGVHQTTILRKAKKLGIQI